jgi:hypothetical protein
VARKGAPRGAFLRGLIAELAKRADVGATTVQVIDIDALLAV